MKKVAQNTEISTSKLKLKAQNIHIKLLLKPWVETACLGENWLCKKWPKWRNFAQSGHTELADRFLAKNTFLNLKGSKKLDAQNLLSFGSKSADEIDRNGLFYKTFKA